MNREEFERLMKLLSMGGMTSSGPYAAPGGSGYTPVNVAAPYGAQEMSPLPARAMPQMMAPAAPSMGESLGGGVGDFRGLRNIPGLLEKIKNATGPGVTFRDNLLGSNYIRGAAVPRNPNIGLPNNAFGIQGNMGSIVRQAMPMRFNGNLFGF